MAVARPARSGCQSGLISYLLATSLLGTIRFLGADQIDHGSVCGRKWSLTVQGCAFPSEPIWVV